MADEEGERVDEVLSNLRGPFPAPQVFPWAKQLIEMLSQLHQINNPPLRWTIQPQNLMVHQPLSKGRIRLWEYGLSADPDPADRYAAPEEHTGKRTNQSDIYRVGAVLYHLLTGKVPPSAQARQARLRRGQADPLEINDQSPDAIQWLVVMRD
jgi:serine/threonine protein kinase